MAPIPSTNLPALPTSLVPWIMWLVIIALSLSGLVTLSFAVRWIVFKTQKALKSFEDRREMDRMVLPTHLRPFVLRPVILPLPVAHLGRERMAYEEQCRMHVAEKAQSTRHQSSKGAHVPSLTRGNFKALAQRLATTCKSTLVSFSSSSRVMFTKAKPSWVSKLADHIKVSTHLVPSPTMDLPMQMPPPGWEDEIEPPREEPPNINNNDELFRKAMAKMDASIRRGPGPYRTTHNVSQQADTVSRTPQIPSLDAFANSSEHSGKQTTEFPDDTSSVADTPALDSIADTSDDEDEDNSPPSTPPLADIGHLAPVASTHGTCEATPAPAFVDIDKHIAAVTGYSSPKQTFGFESYDSLDEIDKRIAATTGFSPQKLHMEALLERTSSPPAQPAVLDLVDLRIAVLTAQGSPRSSPPSPGSVYSPSPGRLSTPRRTGSPFSAADTPQTPTRVSRHTKTTLSTIITTPGIRGISTSSPLADMDSSSSVSDSLFSPTSSAANNTPVKSPEASKAKTQLSGRSNTGSRALPRPMSLPVLPLVKRITSSSLSTPSTPSRMQTFSSSLSSSPVTKLKGSTSRPSRPPFIASSSARLRQVARPSAAPPPKESKAPALRHKVLVNFEPTSTPSPRAKKMWRSLASSDTMSARTQAKPAAGVVTKSKPTWRP